MAKSKVVSSSSGAGKFPQGGNGKMFGKQSAGPKAPGRTGKVQTGDGGKFPAGGNGKMFGKGSAHKVRAGHTGKGSN